MADAVEQAIIGKREAVELVLFALLADGHVLIEDLPGLGKTLLARSFAQVCAMDFARIQFTPDLIPSDITGASIYDRSSGSFTFERGPVFTNILLADEINRAPGKTQAALLEAMEERQVTLENMTRQLESFSRPRNAEPDRIRGDVPAAGGAARPFPRPHRDRLSVGGRGARHPPRTLTSTARADRARARLRPAGAAGDAGGDRGGASPRRSPSTRSRSPARRGTRRSWPSGLAEGSLALMKLARARAAYLGRDFVAPDDVKAVSIPALAHRLTLAPELWVQRIDPADAVRAAVASVPVPVLDESS